MDVSRLLLLLLLVVLLLLLLPLMSARFCSCRQAPGIPLFAPAPALLLFRCCWRCCRPGLLLLWAAVRGRVLQTACLLQCSSAWLYLCCIRVPQFLAHNLTAGD